MNINNIHNNSNHNHHNNNFKWNNLYTDMIISISRFLSLSTCLCIISRLNKHWNTIIYTSDALWNNWCIDLVKLIEGWYIPKYHLSIKHVRVYDHFGDDKPAVDSSINILNTPEKYFCNISTIDIKLYDIKDIDIMIVLFKNLHNLKYINIDIDASKSNEIIYLLVKLMPEQCSVQSLTISEFGLFKNHDLLIKKICPTIKKLIIKDQFIGMGDIPHVLNLIKNSIYIQSLKLYSPVHLTCIFNDRDIYNKGLTNALKPLTMLCGLTVPQDLNLQNLLQHISNSVYHLIIYDNWQRKKTDTTIVYDDNINSKINIDIIDYSLVNITCLEFTYHNIFDKNNKNIVQNIIRVFPNLKQLYVRSNCFPTSAILVVKKILQLLNSIQSLHSIYLHSKQYHDIYEVFPESGLILNDTDREKIIDSIVLLV